MQPRLALRLGWLIASIMLVAAPVAVISQTATDFVYVFPRFSPDNAAELVLSNLSPRLVTADIFFYDPAGGVSVVYAEVAPNAQLRARSADFAAYGARNFDGTVVIRANGPLSAQAKVPFANGFKTLEPSSGARSLVLPFSQGTLGTSEISIYNETESTLSVVVIAVAANGSSIGSAQLAMGPHATRRDLLENAIPAVLSSSNRDVSHLLVRVPNSVLGTERRVFALAAVRGFADFSEVRQRFGDTAFVQAIPDSNAAFNATVPLFTNGQGYSTLVQVINTSQIASSVTLTARNADGSSIGETNPVTVPLPAGGAIRRSVQSLFGLPSGFSTGFISVQTGGPAVTSAAIGFASGGFVVSPGAPAPNTNFAFATDAPNPQFFTGLTFLNPAGTPATVTIRNMLDDGRAVTRSTLRIDPQSSITRNLTELLPEIRDPGFIHIASDVPISAAAFYGRNDGTLLANLSPMHSQPDYNPPDPTTFLITGTVRHNSASLPGVSVQLAGSLTSSTVTDEFGTYVFPNVPNGSYTLRAGATGYTFGPAETAVTIQSESSRGNDFSGTLVKPTITSMQPSAIVSGSGSTTLVVAGWPLMAGSEIMLDGRSFPAILATADVPVKVSDAAGTTTIVNQTLQVLKTTLDAGTVVVPRIAALSIRNNGPGGSVYSAPASFPIGTPAPVLTSLGAVPQPLLAGNAGFTTTIAGTGFLPGATVLVQGVARPTTLLTATTVQVTIPGEDLANGGFLKISAMNPSPTIGPSNSLDLAVTNPVPGVLNIYPNTAEVRLEPNSPPIPLTVAGFGFKKGAKIKVGTFEIPTTFISATTLIGDIPQKALQIGGAFPVIVVNPAPSLGTSESLPLLVTNLRPVLDSIDAGVLLFDTTRPGEFFPAPIVLHGSNFGPSSVFELNPPCTPPSDEMDAFGGGGSTSGSGGASTGGSGGTGGTGGTGGSGGTGGTGTGSTGGSGGTTGTGGSTGTGGTGGSSGTAPSGPAPASSTLVTSHEAIMIASIGCPGTYYIRVRTPQPGGGLSEMLSFVVSGFSQPNSPVITSLSPESTAAGSTSRTLTINGNNFQIGAVVSFGGAVLFPSTVTATTMTVVVPSYLLAVPDVIPVVVTNPSVGGSSNRVLFTVFPGSLP
jgi:hypothetical protein